MTRKHFIALAKALNIGKVPLNQTFTSEDVNRMHAETCRAIAHVCAQTNTLFDRARFLAACGVE
jgi:hypothetical protein